jgi:8-oxo-dGTP pyrophosphatase MutT (NUDIX family)
VSGSGREYRDEDKAFAAGVSNTMRNPLWCHEHHAGLHGDLAILEQKHAASRDDLVDLIHAFVSVELVLLPGLERIQPDEDARRREERRLAHLLRVEYRVLLGAYGFGMLHRVAPPPSSNPRGGAKIAWATLTPVASTEHSYVDYGDALRERCARNLERFDRRAHEAQGLTRAAVAIAIVPDDSGRGCFVLTRRASRLKDHPGQWALPGGRMDTGENQVQTALRECREEVDLTLAPEAVLGLLDDYPTRSGYVITPVVVWADPASEMTANEDEVAKIYRVPLVDLEHPDVPRLRTIPESDRPVISVPLLGTDIHAPTAAILYQLREVVVQGRSTRVDHYEQPVFAWK